MENGIKKLKTGKVEDLVELQAEYLKWGMNTLAPHIMEIFNNNIQQGFPRDWTSDLEIPLFKSGDINNPSNYRTILINPLFAKLFDSMVEEKISKCAEVKENRIRGQVSFRPKHSTMDHGIRLRHIVENVWEDKEEVFFFFFEFKKAFDIVPRDKLWRRMEELGIPVHYRVIAHRIYEEVKVKIRTLACIQKDLEVTMESSKVSLYPLLFLVYILINWKSG